MNASILRASSLLALVGSVFATEPQVRVAASRELRVAIIDFSKVSAPREAMHQAFGTSLGRSLSAQCGAPVGVRVTRVGVDHAAFNLGTGVYDAALIVGRDLPGALRRIDGITLSATPDPGKRDRMLHLLIANGDAGLQGLLATAFTRAVHDEAFLQRLAKADGKLNAPAGEKLATAN